jgi:hypothetical protein
LDFFINKVALIKTIKLLLITNLDSKGLESIGDASAKIKKTLFNRVLALQMKVCHFGNVL